MKKMIAKILIVVFCLTNIHSVAFASENSSESEIVTKIESYISAVDRHDWDTIISLSPTADKRDLEEYYSNPVFEEEKMGYYAVIRAQLENFVPVALKDIASYTDLALYKELYGESLEAYLLNVNFEVAKGDESEYIYNGLNFILTIWGKEDGEWKLIEASQPPAQLVEQVNALVIENDVSDFQRAIQVAKLRRYGIFVNMDGEVLAINNENMNEEQAKNIINSVFNGISTIAAPDGNERPKTIRVYRTSSKTIEKINFYDYCKNVLPNEWIASWSEESLKAGAQCVKFVGWYRVYNHKYYGQGFDVKDSTADQVYKPNTENSNTTKAINAVDGEGMMNSDGALFYPSYRAGDYDSSGKNGGICKQHGSHYLDKEKGYTYWEILKYYYDSSDVSSGNIKKFSY